jgi:hypothetical protein
MIKLIVDFDEEIGFWYFVVREGDETLHFRPGFRTKEEASFIGDAWICRELGGMPSDEVPEES